MEVIDSYYDTYMPASIVSRLTLSDFSACGSLVNTKFNTQTTVVMFYVPECRFCQDFGGELTKFMNLYSSNIGATAAVVDMSLDRNLALGVLSQNFPYQLGLVYPTIIIFYQGHPCVSYIGSRSASYLNDFIIKRIGLNKTCDFKLNPCD
jgi:thiol-disulfide isomerase/thioredoxin